MSTKTAVQAAVDYDWIAVDEMFVPIYSDATDSGYQRERAETEAIRIVDGGTFDKHLFEPLHVSLRANGRYAIVDGHLRYNIALLREEAQLYCVVHHGLKEAQEAELFVKLSRSPKRISPVDLFHAQIHYHQPAQALHAVASATGYTITASCAGYNIASASTLVTLVERFGPKALERSLIALQPWADNGDHLIGSLISGLVRLHAKHGSAIDDERMLARLRVTSIDRVYRAIDAAKRRTGGKSWKAAMDEFLEIYAAGLHAPAKRKLGIGVDGDE